MYEYELVLPGSKGQSSYGREKSLGPATIGLRITSPDVGDDGALTLPQVEWEVVRIEASDDCDGLLIMQRVET